MKKNLADEFMQSVEEMRAYFEGNPVPGTRVRHIEPTPNAVFDARKKLGLTQAQFADVLGVSVSGLRKWEQGTRLPGGAARVLLRLIETHPDIVRSSLADLATPTENIRPAAE